MTDLIVVGGGMMGAPAAYHAARAGADVVVIAPSEPEERATHEGVFGAHYDQSRIFWIVDPDPVDSDLARRSLDLIRDLEAQRQSRILRSDGMLFATAPGLATASLEVANSQAGRSAGVEHLDATEIMARWPSIRMPADVVGYWEPAPAGTLDPRALVAEHLAAAGAGRCEVVDDHAVALTVLDSDPEVHTAAGRRFSAPRVLVAAGAFTNGVLSSAASGRTLALGVKSETVVFAHIPDDHAGHFANLPALLYNPVHVDVNPGDVAEIYATPLQPNHDGVWRLKLGANTIRDRWLAEPDDIADWYRHPPMPSALPLLRRALLSLVPELDVLEWRSERCAITYTPHRRPMIGELVRGRVFVATGGNGHAAKAGPALGELAAHVALSGTWPDNRFAPEDFRVVWSDDPEPWAGAELLADRTR